MKYMDYIVKYMDLDILKEIISWKYANEYSKYDLESYDELKKRNASIVREENKENYLCYFKQGVLVGYTNTIKKENGEVFLGVGVRPNLCNKGIGTQILKHSIQRAKSIYPDSKIWLQVRSWNKRAIRCYEKVGFKIVNNIVTQDYKGEQVEFIIMELI